MTLASNIASGSEQVRSPFLSSLRLRQLSDFPRLAPPRLASPRLASPRLASPRLASLPVVRPSLASRHRSLPHVGTRARNAVRDRCDGRARLHSGRELARLLQRKYSQSLWHSPRRLLRRPVIVRAAGPCARLPCRPPPAVGSPPPACVPPPHAESHQLAPLWPEVCPEPIRSSALLCSGACRGGARKHRWWCVCRVRAAWAAPEGGGRARQVDMRRNEWHKHWAAGVGGRWQRRWLR